MHLISIVLVVIAGVLLFSPDTILQLPDNSSVQFVHTHATAFGLGFLGLAYYFYAADDVDVIEKNDTPFLTELTPETSE